jgi:hypothetical protein
MPVATVGIPQPATPDFEELIDLFIEVRRDLREIPVDLLISLREERLFPDLELIASPDATWVTDPGELAEIRDSLLDAVGTLPSLGSEIYDGLCHGDLQESNFVRDENNDIKVVDLDNICVGPIYSDGLLGLMRYSAPVEALIMFCEKLRHEEARAVAPYDVATAIANGIIWFSGVRSKNSNPVIHAQIKRLLEGLRGGLKLIASIS